jgi:hypothetical protein
MVFSAPFNNISVSFIGGENWSTRRKPLTCNYHYLELCVIIHAWLLLVEVFFKGVHLECEKKPIHIIHFIGYLSAKYLPIIA